MALVCGQWSSVSDVCEASGGRAEHLKPGVPGRGADAREGQSVFWGCGGCGCAGTWANSLSCLQAAGCRRLGTHTCHPRAGLAELEASGLCSIFRCSQRLVTRSICGSFITVSRGVLGARGDLGTWNLGVCVAGKLIFSSGCLTSNTPPPSGDGGSSASASMLPSSRVTDQTQRPESWDADAGNTRGAGLLVSGVRREGLDPGWVSISWSLPCCPPPGPEAPAPLGARCLISSHLPRHLAP